MSQSPRPESAIGRLLHRSFFTVLSIFPRGLRLRIQRMSFDALFRTSSDPWSYQDSEYEAYKRRELLAALPARFHTLLEIGCADGHNLTDIRTLHADTKLVGIDISSEAIKQAQSRNPGNIVFIQAVPGISAKLLETYGTFDVLIFSEVLYYIGSRTAWHELLTPLKSLLHSGSVVIAVHPSSDAAVLHDRLCDILGLVVTSSRQYADESRPFEIRIATLPKG